MAGTGSPVNVSLCNCARLEGHVIDRVASGTVERDPHLLRPRLKRDVKCVGYECRSHALRTVEILVQYRVWNLGHELVLKAERKSDNGCGDRAVAKTPWRHNPRHRRFRFTAC